MVGQSPPDRRTRTRRRCHFHPVHVACWSEPRWVTPVSQSRVDRTGLGRRRDGRYAGDLDYPASLSSSVMSSAVKSTTDMTLP
jgi:hypothetical protein